MPRWSDVPEDIKKRFNPPPDREKFTDQEAFVEAMGAWQSRVGRNLSIAMQRYEQSLPVSEEYSIEKTASGQPAVKITSRRVDWNGRLVGDAKERIVSIDDIEQIVGFCLRSGNKDLMRAVRRQVFTHTHGPEHPLARR